MIDDPSFWHTWNEKLSVAAVFIGGLIGTVIFIWSASKRHSEIKEAIDSKASKKELTDCYDKVLSGDLTAHTRIETKIEGVDLKLDRLKDLLLKAK